MDSYEKWMKEDWGQYVNDSPVLFPQVSGFTRLLRMELKSDAKLPGEGTLFLPTPTGDELTVATVRDLCPDVLFIAGLRWAFGITGKLDGHHEEFVMLSHGTMDDPPWPLLVRPKQGLASSTETMKHLVQPQWTLKETDHGLVLFCQMSPDWVVDGEDGRPRLATDLTDA